MASECTFNKLVYSQQGAYSSVFGKKPVQENISLEVDITAPSVTVIQFTEAPVSDDFYQGAAVPDAVLKAKFNYDDEPYDYFQVFLSISGAPSGSKVALNSSNLSTVPPIEMNTIDITDEPVKKFININTIDPGFETVLSLSFWRNGKSLTGSIDSYVMVTRVTTDQSSGSIEADHQDGPDIYGQPPSVQIPVPVSHMIGKAGMVLEPEAS